ncbi:Putative 2-amino-3-carboxymuconate-6-semialdehyde decarboxylase, metal-dependent hydrolase [Septoria linicola]|uniref:2-amino-3-carboxymuconate-6-semialdehyde decarboxylase n=1 Tax=Septoria linicola TaxID=215465 RepID=A0A9Q9AV81_9PEZI|nr:putative 2-amino-3-carboxymuconate-6-semialdehyde decarboxylase, metal-dependent hydrolase [Septoria linicola]USW53155.1 Putative 2-amino-3-carboxymuconate-6-semialdehyde decarboxylase, metal-dependent hydrolase [Septoria linicola]
MPASLPDVQLLENISGERDWPQLRPHESESKKVDMYVGDDYFRTVEANCFDPETRLDEMRAANVSVQVLSTVPVLFCYVKPRKAAIKFAQYLNDDLAQVCRKYPTSFLGLGTLPLQDIDASVQELQRCKHELGLVDIEIGTEVNGLFLDDPIFEPLWRSCEELDMPLFVHPLGYSLPKENIAVSAQGVSASEHLRQSSNIWVDSLVHDPNLLEYLVKKIGSDRIVMGSDYPFPLGEVPEAGKMLASEQSLAPFLSEGKRAAMLATNALQFLGIERDPRWRHLVG